MNYYRDLTEEEEAVLPLPPGWITATSASIDPSRPSAMSKIYRNAITHVESEEHPFVTQALNAARRRNLPEDWTVKEVLLEDGSKDYFYFNTAFSISMWDPPLLRVCLVEILLAHGYNPVNYNILPSIHEPQQPQPQQEIYNPQCNDYYRDAEALSQGSSNDDSYFQEGEYHRHNSDSGGRANSTENYFDDDDNDDDDEATFHEADNYLSYDDNNDNTANGMSGGEDENKISQGDRHMPNQQQQQQQGSPSFFEERYRLPVSPDAERAAQLKSFDSHTSTGSNGNNNNNSVGSGADHAIGIAVDGGWCTGQYTVAGWERLLASYAERELGYQDQISHRQTKVKPPKTPSGIKVLKADVVEANERVHQLVLKLRNVLHSQVGINCSFVYKPEPENVEDVELERDEITLASDIITALRQQPEFILLTLQTTNKPGTKAMVQIAFTIVHRILHPFSTDNSLTTSLLLSAVNKLLEDLQGVETVFSRANSHQIISRALLISNPEVVVNWDPLNSPLPTVPVVAEETVFSCLLRVYAIRRDVTSYYRSIWQPIMPAIMALFYRQYDGVKISVGKPRGATANHQVQPWPFPKATALPTVDGNDPHFLPNLVAVANRLLECTLAARSVALFPPTATAISKVCREVGGSSTMHNYFLNMMILPNLLKVLGGDRDSFEEEYPMTAEEVKSAVDKYFNTTNWMFTEYLQQQQQSSLHSRGGGGGVSKTGSSMASVSATAGGIQAVGEVINPLYALVWMVWRLYAHAVYMDDMSLSILTVPQFLQTSTGRLPVNYSQFSDSKLRNDISRLRRKIGRGCTAMLSMPIDQSGSGFIDEIASVTAGERGGVAVSSVDEEKDRDRDRDYTANITKNASSAESTAPPSPPLGKEGIVGSATAIPSALDAKNNEEWLAAALKDDVELPKLMEKRMEGLSFKPTEMLNLTIVSREEVNTLFTDVGVALEINNQTTGPSAAALYQAVKEYLAAAHVLESTASLTGQEPRADGELLQLEFLYDTHKQRQFHARQRKKYHKRQQQERKKNNNKSTSLYDNQLGSDDNNDDDDDGDNYSSIDGFEARDLEFFHSEEDLLGRYHQLTTGLKLSNMYEDVLIRMILLAENGCQHVSLMDYVNSIDVLGDFPEFSAKYKTDSVRLANTHTKGSLSKVKRSHHGLNEPAALAIPLEEEPHPNTKPLAAISDDFFKSFRFGSHSASVTVGTSMAREKVLPSKSVHQHAAAIAKAHHTNASSTSVPSLNDSRISKVGFHHELDSSSSSVATGTATAGAAAGSKHMGVGRTGSRYTKIEIDKNSRILAPTKSMEQKPDFEHEKQTYRYQTEQFMKGIRNYDVIPAEEYHRRSQARMRDRSRTGGSSSTTPVASDMNNSMASSRNNRSKRVSGASAGLRPPSAAAAHKKPQQQPVLASAFLQKQQQQQQQQQKQKQAGFNAGPLSKTNISRRRQHEQDNGANIHNPSIVSSVNTSSIHSQPWQRPQQRSGGPNQQQQQQPRGLAGTPPTTSSARNPSNYQRYEDHDHDSGENFYQQDDGGMDADQYDDDGYNGDEYNGDPDYLDQSTEMDDPQLLASSLLQEYNEVFKNTSSGVGVGDFHNNNGSEQGSKAVFDEDRVLQKDSRSPSPMSSVSPSASRTSRSRHRRHNSGGGSGGSGGGYVSSGDEGGAHRLRFLAPTESELRRLHPKEAYLVSEQFIRDQNQGCLPEARVYGQGKYSNMYNPTPFSPVKTRVYPVLPDSHRAPRAPDFLGASLTKQLQEDEAERLRHEEFAEAELERRLRGEFVPHKRPTTPNKRGDVDLLHDECFSVGATNRSMNSTMYSTTGRAGVGGNGSKSGATRSVSPSTVQRRVPLGGAAPGADSSNRPDSPSYMRPTAAAEARLAATAAIPPPPSPFNPQVPHSSVAAATAAAGGGGGGSGANHTDDNVSVLTRQSVVSTQQSRPSRGGINSNTAAAAATATSGRQQLHNNSGYFSGENSVIASAAAREGRSPPSPTDSSVGAAAASASTSGPKAPSLRPNPSHHNNEVDDERASHLSRQSTSSRHSHSHHTNNATSYKAGPSNVGAIGIATSDEGAGARGAGVGTGGARRAASPPPFSPSSAFEDIDGSSEVFDGKKQREEEKEEENDGHAKEGYEDDVKSIPLYPSSSSSSSSSAAAAASGGTAASSIGAAGGEQPAPLTSRPLFKRLNTFTDTSDLLNVLEDGFPAVKHGRSGAPRKKIVSYNKDDRLIEWCEDVSRRSSILSIFGKDANKVSSINLDDVREVRRGIQTDVLKKAGLLDPLCCLSLTTESGYTLDLTFATPKARDEIYRALKALFDFNKSNVRYYK